MKERRSITEEEKYDRWERFAKLLYKKCLDESRESRKQTAKLRHYLTAEREYEVAKQAVAANPEDSEMKDTLNRALQSLDQAREELKRQTANQPRHPPA